MLVEMPGQDHAPVPHKSLFLTMADKSLLRGDCARGAICTRELGLQVTSNFAIGVQPLLACRKHKIHQPPRLDRNTFREVERTPVYGSP